MEYIWTLIEKKHFLYLANLESMLLMHVLSRVATSRCAYHIALRFPSNYVSWLNQGKYKENAKQHRKHMCKRDVAIRQKNEFFICIPQAFTECFSIMHGFISILWQRTKTLTKGHTIFEALCRRHFSNLLLEK